jgi:uncharacterized protein YgiM (DUF1202 family)
VTVSFSGRVDFDPDKEPEFTRLPALPPPPPIETDIASSGNISAAIEEARQEVIKPRVLIQETGLGWLNARSGPGRQFEIITRVTPGDEYDLLAEENNWYQIDHEDGKIWVSGEYAEVIQNQ